MPAFNSYFPATYQPYTQQFYQNPYNQQQIQSNSIIWVGSDAEADAYPIAPNNAITLWNRSLPVVYFKQADASGKPSMKIYELVERRSSVPDNPPQQTPEYVTVSDFHILENSVKELKTEFRKLKRKEEDSDDE